jgi:phosphomannomutase
MIPWLLVAEIICRTGKSLSALVSERMAMFPASGEINRTLNNPAGTIQAIEARYRKDAVSTDHTDGLSMEFSSWRFNLRSSNTEPLVRLNVETRADKTLMRNKTSEILTLLDSA